MAKPRKQLGAALPGAIVAEQYSRCCWRDESDRQCRFPAVWFPLSRSEHGLCRLHDGCPPKLAEAVIDESERWYAAVSAGEHVPLEYTRYDGKRMPGYPLREQLEAEERAAVEERWENRWAQKFCLDPGLEGRERALAMAQATGMLGALPSATRRAVEREPGQDDEELSASPPAMPSRTVR